VRVAATATPSPDVGLSPTATLSRNAGEGQETAANPT